MQSFADAVLDVLGKGLNDHKVTGIDSGGQSGEGSAERLVAHQKICNQLFDTGWPLVIGVKTTVTNFFWQFGEGGCGFAGLFFGARGTALCDATEHV